MHFGSAFVSRIQFAWVIGRQILFVSFVSAAAFIALIEGVSLATGPDVYTRLSVYSHTPPARCRVRCTAIAMTSSRWLCGQPPTRAAIW
jgi:hypothetical protein